MTFEHFIEIAAPPRELFALTQDYSRRLEWDCFLKAAEVVGHPSGSSAGNPAESSAEISIGTRAICTAKTGLVMETEYVSFNPPHTTAVKMTRGPWFISRFAGSWRFEELQPGLTKVTFRYHVGARPKWAAALLSPILAYVFSRDTKRRLIALKSAVEEGGILRPQTV